MIHPTWKGHAQLQLRIEQDANRAADVINSLQSFYKRGYTCTTANRRLEEIIEEMAVLLSAEADRYTITIDSELDADLP
jgi:hypothetical protein